MITLYIIGLILIAITYWVNKRTYNVEHSYNWNTNKHEYSYTRTKSPLWVWLLALVLNIIPAFSIVVFVIGFIIYAIHIGDGDIIFKLNEKSVADKIIKKVKIILLKNV